MHASVAGSELEVAVAVAAPFVTDPVAGVVGAGDEPAVAAQLPIGLEARDVAELEPDRERVRLASAWDGQQPLHARRTACRLQPKQQEVRLPSRVHQRMASLERPSRPSVTALRDTLRRSQKRAGGLSQVNSARSPARAFAAAGQSQFRDFCGLALLVPSHPPRLTTQRFRTDPRTKPGGLENEADAPSWSVARHVHFCPRRELFSTFVVVRLEGGRRRILCRQGQIENR